jgi:hypothetical protein
VTILPIAALVVAPHMPGAIPVVHIDTAARIIIVAVPAEWIISVAVAAIAAIAAVAAVAAVAVTSRRIPISIPTVISGPIPNGDASIGTMSIAVGIAIRVVGAAAKGDAAGQRERGEAKSRNAHIKSPLQRRNLHSYALAQVNGG